MLKSLRTRHKSLALTAAFTAMGAGIGGFEVHAQTSQAEAALMPEPSYSDLVDLGLAADIVAVVRIDRQTAVPPARAPDVPPGQVRLYLQAMTQSLLASPTRMGESVVFLADVGPDWRGKTPKLKDRVMLIFGLRVPDSPNAVQLLSSSAMLPAEPALQARVREVLAQVARADAMSAITGVGDVISVPGNLAGESETQMLVATASGASVALNVIRRPGMAPQWGISLGEIVDQAARPPRPETITWYRLACELPADLPDSAFLQTDRSAREQARDDYAFVQEALGPCGRNMA